MGKNKKNVHRSVSKKFCFPCRYKHDIPPSSARRKVSNANAIVDQTGTEDPMLNLDFFF